MVTRMFLSVVANGWGRSEDRAEAERVARSNSSRGRKKGQKQITYLVEPDDSGEITEFDATEVWVDEMGSMYWPAYTTRTEVGRIGFDD
jgi:hypothetical protein